MALVIEFEVNGERLTSGDEIADAELRTAMVDLRAELVDELGDVRCPVHDEQPVLTISAGDGEEITVGVESCCEVLEDLMEERFTEGEAGDA